MTNNSYATNAESYRQDNIQSRSHRKMTIKLFGLCFLMAGCVGTSAPSPVLMLSHDADGNVRQGSVESLVGAVRNGCELRVAWGARRKSDPERTIEHTANPVWVSVRDSNVVEVQLNDFLINLDVLGEPEDAHPQRSRLGGTSEVVMWRANLKTDGTFDAVWFKPHSGEFIFRSPQRHPMKWFANCSATPATPLFRE